MIGPIFPNIALYSPKPSLLRYIIGDFPNNLINKLTKKVYGEMDIIKNFVSEFLDAFITEEI